MLCTGTFTIAPNAASTRTEASEVCALISHSRLESIVGLRALNTPTFFRVQAELQNVRNGTESTQTSNNIRLKENPIDRK